MERLQKKLEKERAGDRKKSRVSYVEDSDSESTSPERTGKEPERRCKESTETGAKRETRKRSRIFVKDSPPSSPDCKQREEETEQGAADAVAAPQPSAAAEVTHMEVEAATGEETKTPKYCDERRKKEILPPPELWPAAIRPALQGKVKVLEDRPLVNHKVRIVDSGKQEEKKRTKKPSTKASDTALEEGKGRAQLLLEQLTPSLGNGWRRISSPWDSQEREMEGTQMQSKPRDKLTLATRRKRPTAPGKRRCPKPGEGRCRLQRCRTRLCGARWWEGRPTRHTSHHCPLDVASMRAGLSPRGPQVLQSKALGRRSPAKSPKKHPHRRQGIRRSRGKRDPRLGNPHPSPRRKATRRRTRLLRRESRARRPRNAGPRGLRRSHSRVRPTATPRR